MKVATILAFLGMTSASEELFFHPTPSDLLVINPEDEAIEAVKMLPGQCQTMFGYDYYNLAAFDEHLRSKKLHTPAVYNITTGSDASTFMFKACQPAWAVDQRALNATGDQLIKDEAASNKTNTVYKDVPKSCSGKANAFLMTAGECKYSFTDADFTGIANETDDSDSTKGFALTYKSKEACSSDATKKFTFKINAICSKTETTLQSVQYTDGSCEAEITHLGAENCKSKTVDLAKFVDAVSPFLGIILIVGGGGLTFAGAKLILIAFTLLVGLTVTGVLFMVTYNLFIPSGSSSGLYIGVMIVCLLIGGVLGYLSQKFAKAWATTLLATWAGFVAMSLLVKAAGIYNSTAVICLSIAGAVGGGFLGKKLDKHIKSFGTAFIGSYLLIRGIGVYAGGYPSESEIAKNAESGKVQKYDAMIWAYLGMFVFFMVAGSFVQLKYLKAAEEEKKDDAFENEDESKVCGCL